MGSAPPTQIATGTGCVAPVHRLESRVGKGSVSAAITPNSLYQSCHWCIGCTGAGHSCTLTCESSFDDVRALGVSVADIPQVEVKLKIKSGYDAHRSRSGNCLCSFSLSMACNSALGWHEKPFATRRNAPTVSIRRATVKDLDALVDIALKAMPSDPQWDWRFPYRFEFPDDTRLFTRMKYEDFVRNTDGEWLVMLAECRGLKSRGAPQIIAFAIWQVKNLNKICGLRKQTKCKRKTVLPSASYPVRTRQDGNASRMQAWTKTMAKAKKSIFDDFYGQRHFHLQVLATHPEWQRRGAGTSLCNWGIQLAEMTGMAISLFASPMGRKLYRHLGFQDVVEVEVSVEGEHESVTALAMIYEPIPMHTRGEIKWKSRSKEP